MRVTVKQDFNLDLPNGIAVQRITIKPETHNYTIRDGQAKDIPVDVTNHYKLSDGFNMSNDLKIRGFNPKRTRVI